MDLATENARLKALVERLQDEVRVLQQQLGHRIAIPTCLRLTVTEQRLLARLYASDEANKEQLLDAVVGDRLDIDAPEIKIVDVFICKIRRKLTGWGIEILTLWGRGYTLPATSRARLAELMAAEHAALSPLADVLGTEEAA